MEPNGTKIPESPIEPTPCMNLTPKNYTDSLDLATFKSVILDSLIASPDNNTIEIKLEININARESLKTTFTYNPLHDSPSTLSLEIINNLNLPSSYEHNIQRIICESINLNQYQTETETETKNDYKTDIFTENMIEKEEKEEKEFLETLQNDNIVLEDILNVYSFAQQCYINIGCLLSQSCIYFIDAKKLSLWKHFKQITNMDINHIECCARDKIKSYLIGKNLKEIRQEIFSANNEINSLHMLFNIDEDIIPCVMGIKFEGFYDRNVVMEYKRNDILELILNEIAVYGWKTQKKINIDLVIILEKYITNKIVDNINQKVNGISAIYAYDNDIWNHSSMDMDNNIKIDLNGYRYEKIKVFEYGFVLKHKGDIDIDSHQNMDILCCILKENILFEWISYFDGVLYGLSDAYAYKSYKSYNEVKKVKFKEEKKNNDTFMYEKYVHSFKQYDIDDNFDKNKHEYVLQFGFGEKLNYWNKNEINYVRAKYQTFKDELLTNDIYELSEIEYYNIYFQACAQALNKKKNWNCIINHRICMILFRKFTAKQISKFIANCKRKRNDELLCDLIVRNSEIAHFCKYLNECIDIACYGGEMNKKKAFYIGISEYLLFDSISINLQCPTILTMDSVIIQKLNKTCANKNGIILSLKTSFDDNKECIMNNKHGVVLYGNKMNISNIFINNISNKLYISAIQLFENLMNGYFLISSNEMSEKTLYRLINNYASNSNDIKIPKYIRKIFAHILSSNKKQIWMNKTQLKLIKNLKLKQLFFDFEDDKIGSFYWFKNKKINFIQEFEWKINNFSCNNNEKSCEFEYFYKHINACAVADISFYFQLFPQYLRRKCLLRFYIKKIPKNIVAIKVSIDIICNYKNNKKQILLAPKWIENYYDITLYESWMELKDLNELNLTFGIKILDTTQTKTKLNIKKQEIGNKDIDIDVLTQKIRNEIIKDIESKYKQQINALHQRINSFEMKTSDGGPPPNKLKKRSQSYSQFANRKKRKKTFTLMDST